MASKSKKILFGIAVAGMTFGGGFGLAKHKAKSEKDLLKAKIETTFDQQIKNNSQQLAKIGEEKANLHREARNIISSMIEEQNDTTSKRMKMFYSKAKKSFSTREIDQLKDEWINCGFPEIDARTNWSDRDLVNWALNIDGNINTANHFAPNSEYYLIDAPVKHKELAKKRRALKQEWEKIRYGFIDNEGTEKQFIESFAISAKGDTVNFYSYIMPDFADYYNLQHNQIEYWEESYEKFPGGGTYNTSGYRTRTAHITDIKGNLVPNFDLIIFKKYQQRLDQICARLQELEIQEQQLQQIPSLRRTIIADFSR